MTSNTRPQGRLLLRRRIRTIHRWLGLVLALQLLFWISGGLLMSSLDLNKVRGRHLAHQTSPELLDFDTTLASPKQILAQHPASSLTLKMLLGQPVYEASHEGKSSLWDARTGAALSPLSKELAVAVAQADYAGDGPLHATDWVTEAALETRGRDLPLWRIAFDDDLSSTLYVSPDSGQVVARRNNLWRLFDFVWMLHIMDYKQRDNFNNPLLITFAASALGFTLSGFVMLWFSFRKRAR